MSKVEELAKTLYMRFHSLGGTSAVDSTRAWKLLAEWILDNPEEIMGEVIREKEKLNRECNDRANTITEMGEKIEELEYKVAQLQRGT